MAPLSCSKIRDSLVAHIGEKTGALTFSDQCVITLPVKTLDDRLLSIFVEQKMDDYFIVHDGGKNIAELFVQGISLTEHRLSTLETIAHRFGVSVSADGVFTKGCTRKEMDDSILAVTQCASLAMFDVATHHPVVEEEKLETKVNRALHKWKPPYVNSIGRKVVVKGKESQHYLDFVSYSSDEAAHSSVAVEILSPTYSPRLQANQYGFLVLDIRDTPFSRWKRLAVVQRVEQWPAASLQLIGKLSDEVLRLREGEESEVEQALPEYMNRLAA